MKDGVETTALLRLLPPDHDADTTPPLMPLAVMAASDMILFLIVGTMAGGR